MSLADGVWPARVYDELHDHGPSFCICWDLGIYAQMTCRGTCHVPIDYDGPDGDGGWSADVPTTQDSVSTSPESGQAS